MSKNSNFNKNIDQPFGWEPNEIIFNQNLSLKAKGLWLYMNAKPDGWYFASERIAKESTDGISSVRAALKELADNGLLKWKKQGDGRVIYTLESHCFPQGIKPELENLTLDNEPELENPIMRKSHNEKISLINNKEDDKERIIKKKTNDSALAEEMPSRITKKEISGVRYNRRPNETDEEFERRYYEERTVHITSS